MTTYFTTTQRNILKYAWIPVIFTLIIYAGVDYWLRHFYRSGQGDSIRPWLLAVYYLPLIGTIGYDMLMRRNVLHLMLILLAALCMNGCMFWMNNSPHLFKPAVVMGFGFNCLYMTLLFLVFLVRAYLLKLKRPLLAGLLAMFVGWYAAPLGNSIYYLDRKLGFDFFTEQVVNLPFRSMYPLVLLIVLALADNLANIEGYVKKLRSKVQVIDAKEYLLLYFVTSWTCFFGAILMGREVHSLLRRLTSRYDDLYITSSPYVELTTLIGVMLCCIAAGYLLRNILISRMSTIGSSNEWLYVLHYSFPLNIIPVIIWGRAKKIHETIEENATFYLFREPSSVGIAIMWFGCITGLVFGMLLASHYSMGFAVPVLLSALMHGLLRQMRQAINYLIVINVGVLIFTLPSVRDEFGGMVMMMALTSVYLSAYLLREVFHPRLSGKDELLMPVSSV